MTELEYLADQLTGGVDPSMVEEAGGVEAFARQVAAYGCSCEPCLLEGTEGHDCPSSDCLDYTCMGCEAQEYLVALTGRKELT